MVAFGTPGTNHVIYAESWNQPKGTVLLMAEESPTLGYVIDETGNWVQPANAEHACTFVRETRKKEILSQWPVDKQLEAITDQLAGNSAKFDQLQNDLIRIKLTLPFLPEKIESVDRPKTKVKQRKK